MGRLRIRAAIVVLVSVCACAQANELGRPVDLASAPHIRPGMWSLRTSIEGHPLPAGAICDGGRSIVSAQHPGCDPWSARFVAPDRYVLTDICHEQGQITRAHRDFSGDLRNAFAVTDTYSTEVMGITTDKQSSRTTYRFEGSCPSQMQVKEGNF